MATWFVVGCVVVALVGLKVAFDRLSDQVTDLRERLDATQSKLGELQSDVEDSQGAPPAVNASASASLRSSGESPRY